MEDGFEEYWRYFLKRYGINPEKVDFDVVNGPLMLECQLGFPTSKKIDLPCAIMLICILYKEGVHLYQADYKLTEAYSRRKYEWVNDNIKGVFLTENYIERFLLSDAVKEAVYQNECKYTMGNPYQLTPQECAIQSVAKEIAKRECKNINVDISDRVEKIRKGFYRKGGIIYRLKRDLEFDIKVFDKLRYGSEICKIIYFVYEMENEKVPNLLGKKRFELPEFIKNSSMESMDNSIFGQEDSKWETPTGKVTRLIRNTLDKEISLETRDRISYIYDTVLNQWDKLIARIRVEIERKAVENGLSLEFDKIRERLNFISDHFDFSTSSEPSQISPIETLYFLTWQHEILGEVNDIKKIINMPIRANYDVPDNLVWKMCLLQSEKIPLEYVKKHICDNANLLVEYVYLGETVDQKEHDKRRRQIYNASEQVYRLLNSVMRRRPLVSNLEDEITTLYLVSCLQAILTDENNVPFEYDAYELRNCKPLQISGILRETNAYALDSRRAYWEQKIAKHLYANCGKYNIQCDVIKSCNICYDVMAKICSAKTDIEMQYMHQIYYGNLMTELTSFLGEEKK